MHVADWTFSNCFSDFFVINNMMLKGIVHPKRKMWCLSAYHEGIHDVGDFIYSVEHKRRLLTQTFAVCQSYNVSQWDPQLRETKKKTYTDKTKLNPVAHDNTMKSYDTKQSVCARNWTVWGRGSHWLTLYDWQTAKVWVNNLRLCSTEEIKSPTSWMPSG